MLLKSIYRQALSKCTFKCHNIDQNDIMCAYNNFYNIYVQ